MKAIYLLLLLACVQSANGQDYCKLVKKEISGDKKTFNYESPYDPQYKPALRVTRSYNNDPDDPYDNFFIVFRVEGQLESIYNTAADGGQTEKTEKKLEVVFEDKTTFVDDTIQISHDVSDDKTQAVRYIDYPLTAANLKDFTTKKIVKFSLAGNEQLVAADSANSIMHYVQCMKAVK